MGDGTTAALRRIEAINTRIELKLDQLIEALAADEEPERSETTLDGGTAGRARDESQSLG